MPKAFKEKTDLNLGPRIRKLREEKGLKIVQVAKATGLTSSMISQLERGLISPSIETLKKIGDALDTHIGFLFLEDGDTLDNIRPRIAEVNPVAHENGRKIMQPEKGITYQLLNPNLNGPIEFIYNIFQPGARLGDENYVHVGHECGLILEGELVVIIGEKEYVLKAGDSITFCSETPHRKMNRSDAPCICVWANTPPWF